jgi:alpha-glucosidase
VAVLYAGEEIGMVNADPSVLPDPPFDRAGRDGARTPMQWDGSPSGGFTTGTPWLPLVDPARRNVADQSADPASLLSLYRRLIAARREVPALGRGTHRSIFGVAPDALAWVRELDGERVLVLLNLGGEERRCSLTGFAGHGDVLVGTDHLRAGRVALDGLTLAPLEGLALRL